jgi:uncharacterized protein YutE (UPF0331/DUF86 family)
LADLDQYLAQLGEYVGISEEAYRGDWKVQRIVERTLQMMIELCVDVAHHLIADRALRVPTGYADTFAVLREAGMIDERLREVLARMVRFRNVLVHEYERIDTSVVMDILKNRLQDFRGFRGVVLRLLNGNV